MLLLAPLIKHNGFTEEGEWRIIANEPKDPIKFRVGVSYLCPYIELPLLSSKYCESLKTVIVGPNPNLNRAEISLDMFLKSKGFADITLVQSNLPFVNW